MNRMEHKTAQSGISLLVIAAALVIIIAGINGTVPVVVEN